MKRFMKPTQFNYNEILFSSGSDYDDDQMSFAFEYESFKPTVNETTFNIDDEMNKAYQRNESKIKNESIRPIANGIYSYYNSLNILVGQQGKGKSHIMLRDVIQMSRMKNAGFHLIVYVSRNGTINDATFESQRELIQLPIKTVADSNAEEYLKQLDLYKELYNKYSSTPKIVIEGTESPFAKQNEKKLNDMFEFLHINKLGQPNKPLNTIILCEDFLKSKLIKSSYFINTISQLRHKNLIIFVNIQFFKALTTEWKNNATSFFIFSGYSRQKLGYIYQQVPFPIDFEELWNRYRTMKAHQFVLINVRTNNLSFI